MKILLLADQAEPTLWEHLDKRKLEGVELVLACGDLPASYLSFLTCFTAAPILYIRGNHDDRYAQNPPEGCLCIEDQVVTVGGLRILGLGGSMRYNRGVNQYTEKQMRQRVQKLRFKLWRSGGIDILMTHSPARSLGDDTDLAHTGFKTFLDGKVPPALHGARPRSPKLSIQFQARPPSRRHHRHQCVRLLPAGCARNRTFVN